MAVNQIKTRILNKYDSLTNWNNATTFYPRAGEICLANLGTQQVMGANGETRYEPIIGIKVGIWDGVTNSETQKNFKDLQWVQAIAGDVSSFLKGLNKQEDFDAYVKNLINNGYISDVTKDIEGLTGRVVNLENTVNDTTTGVAAINTRLTSIDGSISTISGNVTTLTNNKADKTEVTEAINTAKGDLNTLIQGVQTNLNNLETNKVNKNAEAISGINANIGDTEKFTGNDISSAIKALQDSVGDSSEGLGSQVADLKNRMDDAEDAIETKAAQADLGALQGRVTTVENDLNTPTTGLKAKVAAVEGKLEGIDNTVVAAIGKSEETINAKIKAITDDYLKAADKQALQTQIDTIMSNPDAEGAINSINEFTQYVKDHGEIAEGFRSDINGLKEKVDTGDLTVSAYVSKALEDSNLDQYASAEELASVSARVTVVEGTANDASSVNSIPGAKKYAEEKASAAQTAAEATAAADATAKANAAQAAAEATAAADATAKANAAQTAAEGKVTALANGAVKTNTEAIASHTETLNAMNVTDAADGVVTKVDQANGKITVTHKKITMDEFDPNATFIFYCGTASDVI